MDITAANAKIELTPELSREWLRVLSKHPLEAIEEAFRSWRDRSSFFPAISEIQDLIRVWDASKREEQEAKEHEQERIRTEQARGRGDLIEFADLQDLCRKVAAEVRGPVPQVDRIGKPMESPERPALPELSSERKEDLKRRLDGEIERRKRRGKSNGQH
jgi:hypothetical protein